MYVLRIQVAKILKKKLFEIENFKLNGTSPVSLLLDLHFQGQTSGIIFDL